VTTGREAQKEAARRLVAANGEALVELSHRIHAHPELSFEEVDSSTWCADALEEGGFEVTRHVADIETAFVATAGSGDLTIAICCEYDALPDIGHACGHNIIAAAAVGAGLGLTALADELGLTIKVLGTPAEEGGGGKILMLDRGAFDGLHAAMMVHPFPSELIQMPCLAVAHFDVFVEGVEAHASAFPELGRNAADALTVAQVAIGLLRQHSYATDQVHGITTYGGAAPNIVPARAAAKYYVRSATLERLTEWEPRIRDCFKAGALATGTSVRFEVRSPSYSEFRIDEPIAALYKQNAEGLGRVFPTQTGRIATASTDMANVSLAMPAIHPTLDIGSLPAVNHQASFAAACITGLADKAVVEGATAMAQTVIDLATDEAQRGRLLASTYRHT
jgi:amidohydrolase